MFLDPASVNIEEVIIRQREEGYTLMKAEISNDRHSVRPRQSILELHFAFGDDEESSLMLTIARANFGYDGAGPIDTAQFIYCASRGDGALSLEDIRQQVFAEHTDSTVREIHFRR